MKTRPLFLTFITRKKNIFVVVLGMIVSSVLHGQQQRSSRLVSFYFRGISMNIVVSPYELAFHVMF